MINPAAKVLNAIAKLYFKKWTKALSKYHACDKRGDHDGAARWYRKYLRYKNIYQRCIR